MSQRKVIDCRNHPGSGGCTLAMEGTEREVLEVATAHAQSSHQMRDDASLQRDLRSLLRDSIDGTFEHGRRSLDCRSAPNGQGCSLKLSCNADQTSELITAGAAHAVKSHGARDDNALRSYLSSALREESGGAEASP